MTNDGRRIANILTMGRSAPSIMPDWAAGLTSPQGIGTALPPSPLIVHSDAAQKVLSLPRPGVSGSAD
jgi:hypothetical protein